MSEISGAEAREYAGLDEPGASTAGSVSPGLTGYVYKGWVIEYMPKPGRPGYIDWDATHPDEETGFNGKSPTDLQDQIDAFLDT